MIRQVVRFLPMLVAMPAFAQSSQLPASFIPLDSLVPPSALSTPIALRLDRVPLRAAVNEIAQRARVSIVFDPGLAGLDRPVSVDAERVTAARVLLRVLDDAPLRAMTSPTGAIVLVAKPKSETERPLVAGTIRQADGPLSGVHVSLVGTRFETATDAAGRFVFGTVPLGHYQLRAMRMGFAPVNEQIQIEPSAAPIELSMSPIAVPVAAVIVTPGYYGVMQPGMATAQALTRQQIETVPQLGEDVYRAMSRLPGVTMNDYSAKFSLRGESGDGLAVTLDGLPLIEPFHLKDMGNALSIVDMWSLGGAELITGGPSAEFGDQLNGVFRLHTIEPRVDRVRGTAGLSLTNLRGGAQGGFGDGKGSWLVSGRRGFLDLAFKAAALDDSIRPTYDDVYAKVAYDLPGGGRIAAHALHAGDRLSYKDANGPNIDSHYQSDYGWLTLASRLGDRARHEGVAWLGHIDWTRLGSRVSGTKRIIDVRDVRSLATAGVRDDWSIELGKRALFKVGGTFRHEAASYDYTSAVQRQSVVNHSVVTRMDSVSALLAPTADRADAYVAQRVRPIDALTLEVGARYDRASHTGDAIVSPRVNASWQPLSATTLRAAWGKHVQSQSIFGLQVEDGVRTFAPAERATQLVVGVDQRLWNGLAARVEGYHRTLADLRPRYMNTRSGIEPFPEIENDRVLVPATAGRATGVEMVLSRDAGRRVDWTASYVLSTATQLVNDKWLPRVNDQPRAVNLDWSFHPVGNAWRLSMSAVWHSGWPYTPELVQIDTVGTAPQQGIFASFRPGALYADRLPSYKRLDARWTRFIDTNRGRVSLFVEVYNLLNNDNLRDRYTNISVNRLTVSYASASHTFFPRIPSFGINWEF